VNSAALGTGAVTAGKIGTGGVSASSQLAAGVVDEAAIGSGAVTNAKLGTLTDATKWRVDIETNVLYFDDNGSVNVARLSYDGTDVVALRSVSTNRIEVGNSTATYTRWDDGVGILHKTNAASEIHKFETGSVVLQSAALATTATDGFAYIPTCAGNPTGTPTAQTGTVAMVFDSTNNALYVYDGGWIKVALT
jgi:hypothetical protein